MKAILTKIGDHYLKIFYHSMKIKKWLEKSYTDHLVGEDKIPDLNIYIRDEYGVSFTDYNVEITKDHNRIQFRRADYLIEVNSDYTHATISVFDELALKHAFMNLYSSFIVHHNWGLLMHSSCAIENQKAHIFAGQSGRGKSTAARLSYPRILLSDEATIVKITSDDVEVYNSPFRSELLSDQMVSRSNLSSIQILYQSLQNSRKPIGKSEAIIHLIDKIFFWPHGQEEIKVIMGLLTILVNRIPVYNLHFQKNNTFWELIS